MTDTLTITLAQLNPRVGDIAGNLDKLRRVRAQAAGDGADVILTPELYVCGYPPEDLVLKPMFVAECRTAIEELARETGDGGPAVLLGAPWLDGGKLYNAMLLLDGGRVVTARYKVDLPNYGVFDEKRVFAAGPPPGPIDVRGVRIGVPICEDIWTPEVVECVAETGGEILLVPNGSPFELGKSDVRVQLGVARVVESGLPLVYLNQIGGQDELVFDGASFVLNADRDLVLQMPAWQEAVVTTRWTRGADGWSCAVGDRVRQPEGPESLYCALMTGLRDYVGKNGFPGVILGMSGGIDSALSAAVAVDALGADKVRCVMMPSPYTSDHSLQDAAAAAQMLGVDYRTINIGPAMQAFDGMLADAFAGTSPDITEENIQARSRGITLMALSNKFGHMVLSTGNKSEMSVGYATLYGDMCGGYSVLKDVYKMSVFELSRWRNAHRPATGLGPDGPVMPERIITKPPSAELRPDQKDEDSLPPYPVLDAILTELIENETPIADIVGQGHEPETVLRVWKLLDRAEYKRRQAPPGVKVTGKSFGKDRRYPITNAFVGVYRPSMKSAAE
ncbi:NAD+ synthase [Thalassobaculum fulvum]|uniref:Glutamine-dependent NAD(+) synthetase n=1 Tax=Thalassobaculum fulvum TaxID=1633335 RepID=A0A919CRW5_9PROT|nr:NAD+ synthase [Thalassobaculum fulvum]GHD61379.1 NAD+ synthase [Thalassobaculum fulvum]